MAPLPTCLPERPAFGRAARKYACACAAAMVSLVSLPAAGAAATMADAGGPVRLAYEAYLGPLFVFSAEVDLRVAGDGYEVVTRAKSTGVASVLFSWRNEARSEGRRAGARLVPRRHEMDGRSRGEANRVRLSYGRSGPVEALALPAPDPDEREPVPAALTVGTVDPLSATLDLMMGIAGGGRCEGEYRVFDGRRRYDMIVRPGASAILPRAHASIYAGPAERCDFQLVRIAGFAKKPGKLGRQVVDPMLWVASPYPGLPPVPVRFTAETGFGEFRIHLTRVQQGRMTLALPES
jgi:hypothetical protein